MNVNGAEYSINPEQMAQAIDHMMLKPDAMRCWQMSP